MIRRETSLPGIAILEPKVWADERGFFFESYNARKLRELGIDHEFVQHNHSGSVRYTLRGLHYQLRSPQTKIVRVIRGEVLDVAVDVRKDSPTFRRWVGIRLSAENRRQVYIPRGFAHGFRVLSDYAEFVYLCDQFYDQADERGIRWDDPSLGIDWELDEPPLLSPKDQSNPFLRDLPESELPSL